MFDFLRPRRNTNKGRPKKRVTLDDALEQAVIDKAQKDKPWALKTALKKMGIEEEGPIEQTRERIKSKITDEALKKISEDPEMAGQFIEAEVGKILGHKHGGKFEGEEYYPQNPVTEALEQIRSLREIESELGGGKKSGGISDFLNPDVMKEVMGLIKVIIQAKSGAPDGQNFVVIEVDGKPTRVTEEEYQVLVQQGRVKPIAAIASPAPTEEGVEEVSTISTSKTTEPELPDFIQQLNLEEVAEYMALPPTDFVDKLDTLSLKGDHTAQMAWAFMAGSDYDAIAKIIEPYRNHSKVGLYVELILSDDGKGWLGEVIRIIKEREELKQND